MKYLQVEIEEQENVFCGEGFRDKGKGKEVIVKKVKIEEVVKVEVMEGIDFDTVLDGMDWDDMDMLSQNTTPAVRRAWVHRWYFSLTFGLADPPQQAIYSMQGREH